MSATDILPAGTFYETCTITFGHIDTVTGGTLGEDDE